MISDHKKGAELRVTRDATKRYAIEMSDLEKKIHGMEEQLSKKNLRLDVKSATAAGLSTRNKENKVESSARGGSTSTCRTNESARSRMSVEADVASAQHAASVRDVLLRANLAGLMNGEEGEEEDGLSYQVKKDLMMKKSHSTTSVLRRDGNGGSGRRRLRPKSANIRGRGNGSSGNKKFGSGRRDKLQRPKSAARGRR